MNFESITYNMQKNETCLQKDRMDHCLKSQNHLGWKRPLRSLTSTEPVRISDVPPNPALSSLLATVVAE